MLDSSCSRLAEVLREIPMRASLLLSMALVLSVVSTGLPADAPPDFAHDVLPLLKTHCVRCHGPAKQEAQLSLALATGVKRGGENGPPSSPVMLRPASFGSASPQTRCPPNRPCRRTNATPCAAGSPPARRVCLTKWRPNPMARSTGVPAAARRRAAVRCCRNAFQQRDRPVRPGAT